MKEKITVYEPDNVLKNGYFSMFREIFSELTGNKWLIFQLFKRNLLKVYKQSILGVLWVLIFPLLSVLTFVILNSSGVFSLGRMKVPYAIFAVFGLSFWQFFSTGLIAACNSLVEAGSMIVKINFSKKSLVLASSGQAFISSLIQFVLIIILFFIYNFSPTLYIVLTPILILPLILLTIGLGLIFSILNGILREIGTILSVLMTFLMFLTPILYIKPESGILATISDYNILYYLITFPRDLVLTGNRSGFLLYLYSSIAALLLWIVSILIFHMTESRVTERI